MGFPDGGTTGLAMKDDDNKAADREDHSYPSHDNLHGVPLLQVLPWLLISSRTSGECPTVRIPSGQRWPATHWPCL